VNGNLALMGDAAHVASPITGAGAYNAMADARSLARAIFDSESSSDPESIPLALKRYERDRLRAVRSLVRSGAQWGVEFVRASQVALAGNRSDF
jgi:2-polyprenyl-6-methoxyphenol hydroxylase-like FAD-dependent oxidoreductase